MNRTLAEVAAAAGLTKGEARSRIHRLLDSHKREGRISVEAQRRSWTKDDILVALQDHVRRTGTLPRKVDLDPRGQHQMPSHRTILRSFGSLAAAFNAAGLVTIEQATLFDYEGSRR